MSSNFTTSDIVNKVYLFCEELAGSKLFAYQSEFAKRIIRAVITGEGAELTALFSRQSGKSFTVSVVMSGLSIILPILANMPMFANDKRLQTYKKGFMLGIFAPSQKQARIIFGNIKKFLSSPHSCDILTDPEINIIFEVSNGENVSMKFKNLGISSKISCITASETANIEGESCMVVVVDEAQDVADFVYKKSIFPMGAFYNATYVLIGTSTTKRGFFYESIENNKKEYANGEIKKSHFENDYKTVEKYNENYKKHVEGAKKKLGEDSDEFKMSYKLMWLLSRGMFITAERLDAIADTSADIYLADKSKAHVAGIDLGKSKDSTVITILEVDWENPVIIEESKDPDVPDFAVYSTMIKHWVELQGDDWNEQESDILTALEPFEISKVVIDATGVGSSVYDHLNVVLSQRGVEAIPYAFSTQSKSALFKFLDSQIKGGRAKYPACADLQENSREYKRFVEQMSILEKSYSGQHMVCAAPNNTKAHDDYPVSWALAQWAARGEPGVKVEVVQNNIFKPSPTRSNYYYGRNRYTARR